MSLQKNIVQNPPLAPSEIGGSRNSSRHNNDGNAKNSSSGKELIVQKLQGVLVAIRQDRDREHRGREIAMEKLRSAKESFQAKTANYEAEKEELMMTRDESEEIQKEIFRKEAIIQELKEKYRFQHEDLIRKREKINQQSKTLEVTTLHQNKSVLDIRRRLDRQRHKFQKLKRMEEEESMKLISSIISLTNDNKNLDSHNSNTIFLEISEAESNTEEGIVDKKETRFEINSLIKFQEAFEKKQEQALMREFKTNIDYAMLPDMIARKAKALKKETESIHAEINRLGTFLHGTSNVNDRRESSVTFAATMNNDVGGHNPQSSSSIAENTKVGYRF